MALIIDQNLVEKLEADPEFQILKDDLNYPDNRVFKRMWAMHQVEDSTRILKWHPVLIKDRDSKIVGFEFNPTVWGSKKMREKLNYLFKNFSQFL